MVIISRQGSLGLLYTWTIIILGGGWLWIVFPQLNFDQIDTLAILIVLGILAEWVAVPFSQGYLSGGFVIVLAAQLIGGGVATVWVTGLISVIGLGIANRGNPLRTTLFNGAQHVLAAAVADIAFSLTNGEVLPIFLYTLVYFGVNHLLVYLYLLPGCRDHPGLFGWDALRWDSYTYLLTAPYGALMAKLYLTSGTKWALLFFLPVLAAQILLKKYVQLEESNRELTALFQVAKGLRGRYQQEEFFDQILQEARRMADYHTALILIWSQERQLFLPGAAQGAALEETRNLVLTPGEGLVGQAVQSKESLLVDDIREIPAVDAGPFGKFRSLLITPLLSQGEVTGVLILGEMRPYAYEEKHLQMLDIIGGQAGIVLAHGMLLDKIKYLSVTDRLTNFLHHRQFYQLVVKEMVKANAEGTLGALLLVDIDNLRRFQAHYGHAAGDGVIQMVASVLRDVTPPSDILCRYGGGELAVLAMGLATPEALQLAEKIRIEVRDRRLMPEGARAQVMVTVSIGVAVFPQDASDPDKLFQGAEKAVARAKELGRDRSIAYSQLIKQMKFKITSAKNNVVQ
ncbi:sensor domain-containing diguanylate cyclase [Desulforamulus reducens]|uniref:sensor domain-containing diguanylate cyclase n=1 Tax=Desulforamulus reducens TaxID=59610 RepID=UPI0002E3BC6C|nr:sensor domain-containing diguanylate cyclase [Desulforamulus reducens]